MSPLIAFFIIPAFAVVTDLGPSERCRKVEAEVDALFAKDPKAARKTLAEDQVPRALVLLSAFAEEPPLPLGKDFARLLRDDFATTFLSSLHGKNDCPSVRLLLTKALIDFVKANPGAGVKIKPVILRSIRTAKFPSLLNAMIDITLLNYALESGAFETSTAGRDELINVRRAARTFSEMSERANPKTLEPFVRDLKDDSPTSVAKLKNAPYLNTLRKVVTGEYSAIEGLRPRIEAVAAKFN